MFKWKNEKNIPCISSDRMPYLFLLAAGIIEFLFITLESLFSGLGYYLAEDYLIVPCLLFLGYVLHSKLTTFSRRRLVLAVAAISWFVITQIIHKLSGMETHPLATVFFVYLMAFPFAALTDDRDNAGYKIIGKLFLAAGLVLVGYTVLLILGCVPEALKPYVYWDGARLHPFWHPNNGACFFLIGIGFAAAFLAQAKKPLAKVLLAVAIAALFVAMALTNCRTALLLTCAFFGGMVFCLLWKGGWKRFLLGLLAAAVVFAGSWKLSGAIYQQNHDRLFAQILAPQESDGIYEGQNASIFTSNEGEVSIQGESGQGSLSNDMPTLNNRTNIWNAAFRAVRDSKPIALWGTEYAGTVISAYYASEVVHAHNSWIEALMRMGLPGLMMSLVFTALSVWSAAKLVFNTKTELWKKIIAMMTMCVMAAGFLEPYLFITNVYYHVTDFMFFFCTGYLDYWCNAPSRKEN